MIESLLKSVFKKVNRQKVKWTVHPPNREKFEVAASDALNTFMFFSFIYLLFIIIIYD